jgi:hypothetical protein
MVQALLSRVTNALKRACENNDRRYWSKEWMFLEDSNFSSVTFSTFFTSSRWNAKTKDLKLPLYKILCL